ncbi:snRNA-activating protein complex subunit 4 isoform X2 [Sander lucioperca]|uniref:snRNA-activating protein complex subunit 4 isoform X2 n=1 Tax=Sander lucioperca TaxID=283035 RepID=UPI001653D650|nr:snRNA-activating protein complex subunit 4 isoform X2 [Sander lucioperca]
MSVSLSAERDRIQRQVEELEQSLSATNAELELLSSETDDKSDDDDATDEEEERQSAAGLLAQREKIQKEIQNLENVLGPIYVSDDDSSSEESELGLSPSVDSCLQMNLVYQQVVKETLDQLETLLTQNHQHQKELLSQLSGPMKSYSREQSAPSSCQQPISMFLGRFLKPYFKDKLTGLGPPANQEAKEKASRMTGSLDDRKLRVKRWESWQKTLLIHSVTSDSLRKLIQPKLSKLDYLSQKLSSAAETDRQQLREQIDRLERDIDLLREKTEAELIGDQYDAHDWQKIANVDFEGTRDAEDIRRFWQNFLHPAVNKSGWSQEELQQLKELSRTHAERHWDHIAEQLGTGRTPFMCLQTFQRFVSDSLKRGSWTPAEDDMLRELVKEMRIGNFIPYTQISYFMEGRDPSQLIYRWNQVLDPSLKKGFWTKEEDELLLNAVSRYGEKDWWKIRFEVPGRTDSGCRDRYYDCLKAGTKKGPFDQQEKDLLRQLVKKHGVGRWAKIAAEIPDRYDAQCLREWRKLSKPPPPPPAQVTSPAQKVKRVPKSRGGKRRRKAGPARKRIRKRLMKLQKEEMSEESSEDEAMVIEYMDSDEEEKKKKEEEVQIREEEEKEEEYIFPPMEEWIPVEEAQSNSSLSFRPAELPSSAVADNPVRVRSTIVGQYGRSVIIGPRPRQLQWEGHHGNSTMMMVTPSQLQTHLQRQAKNSGSQHASPRGKIQIDKNNPLGRVMDKRLSYKLQAAVTPWIGHLLIPAEEKKKRKVTAADALRERREKREPLSTPFFLLLLQSENVDALGCKEMIEQRRKKVVTMGPRPRPSLASTGGRKTVAGILYERKPMKVEQQELDLQHKLILNQLQALQQQQQQRAKQKQLLLQQHARQQQLMLRQQHALPSQNHPGFLLQMNPGMSFRQPVFIPVTQPCAPPIQFMSPSALNTAACRPPPVTVVTSPYPAHPASHRLGVPSSVTVVPVHLNATSTSPVSFRQQAVPLTQNPVSALAPYLAQQHVSIASTLPSQHVAPSESTASVTCPSPSSSMSSSSKRGRKKVAEDQVAVSSSQSGEDMSGASDGVDGAKDSAIKDGRRIRKPSQKAKALQEAIVARAEANKKAASSPRKKAQIQNTNSPPTDIPVPSQTDIPVPSQTDIPVPSQTDIPVPSQTVLPVPSKTVIPVNSSRLPLNATAACSDRSVSSTHNLSLAPPASSTLSLLPSSPKDHDYTFINLGPTPSQRGSKSIQPSTDSGSSEPLQRVEEQPCVISSQDDQCESETAAGGNQKGKRTRKPTQRVKDLQEATQAKVEAKKKKASTPPREKRPRKSRAKKKVIVKNEPVIQPRGFHLLPSQSMWVMTPGGLVQLTEGPQPGLQLALLPNARLQAPHGNSLNHPVTPALQFTAGSPQFTTPQPTTAVSVPVNHPFMNQPHLLPARPTSAFRPHPPAFILQPVSNPRLPPPPPKLFLPYKGTVTADPTAPPPLRREALKFDPSLMFLEPQDAVQDWLSGQGGVVVPGLSVALPYLPPFVSSLSTLSALLRAKKSLTKSFLKLLSQRSQPRRPNRPGSCTERTSNPSPDLPDSTSDLQPAGDTPAASVSSAPPQEGEEAVASVSSAPPQEDVEAAEIVAVARRLVAERFSSNPAYQLLKARFLSCFTVPALLAAVQPIGEKTAGKEEEEEDEVDVKTLKERGRRRRAERSLLLCDGSGASANHFSGINNSTPDQTVSVQ